MQRITAILPIFGCEYKSFLLAEKSNLNLGRQMSVADARSVVCFANGE
jgi:hypothetical protein